MGSTRARCGPRRRRRAAASIAALFAAGWIGGCATRSPGAAAYPELRDVAGQEIRRVIVVGAEPFSGDTLGAILETEPTHCSLLGLPICIPGTRIGLQESRLNLDRLRRDVARLALFYRRSGFFGAEVAPEVERRPSGKVDVYFVVAHGDPVRLASLTVRGTEGILDPAWLARRLPLSPGRRFDLGKFAAAADTIVRALRARGYAHAQVLRSFDADVQALAATATLTAAPGPQVVVDSVIVTDAEHLGRGAVLRQLAIHQGDPLRLDRLVESQRNLYALEIVQFATVQIAPDELQVHPADSSTATLLISISEGPVHVVDAAAGYGTVECLRTRVRWTSRSFGGGARTLVLGGSVSKIGIGRPLDFGFSGICPAFRQDRFRDELDYRLSADLTQPWFLSPRNHLTASVWSEQLSEPRVFQRKSTGARLAMSRRLAPRNILTPAIQAEYGRTLASEAVFCLAFEVCDPADVNELARPRWLNTLGAGWVRDRTNLPLDPTRGTISRLALTWAPAWMGSGSVFVRSTGEVDGYRPMGRQRVGAAYIRIGTFFGTGSINARGRRFIPPEERFYAGGSNSVRGFARNAMGPGVYVARSGEADPETGTVLIEPRNILFVPLGGTGMVTGSAELRMPSPVLKRMLRLALFVDGGALGSRDLGHLRGTDWAVTPGLGVRFGTPVGPVRVDVAYNPFPPRQGPLYVPGPDSETLVRVADNFRPAQRGFFRRFQLHLGVGQAF